MHADTLADAHITLFGHPPTPARVEVLSRALSWRLRRAMTPMGVALVAAPALFVIPPHVPWALGALAAGIFIARRRWTERFTIQCLEGACPRCGNRIRATPGERLRDPHTLSCEGCRHDCTLVVTLRSP